MGSRLILLPDEGRLVSILLHVPVQAVLCSRRDVLSDVVA